MSKWDIRKPFLKHITFEIDFEKWLEFYVTETDKKEIQDRMKTINKKKKARHVWGMTEAFN